MGNAAIYYYPQDDGPLVVIDLGEPLSDLQIDPVRIVDTNTGRDFEPSTVDIGGSHRARMVLERFTGAALVSALQTFEVHALRGKPFGIVDDTDHAWCGFANPFTIEAGKLHIPTSGNVFSTWDASATLAVNDKVMIHGANPEYHHETKIVTAYDSATGKVTWGITPTLYNYTVGPVVIRHHDFMPFCYLDPDERSSPFLTDDHRINYTLDLPCIYSPSGLTALWGTYEGAGSLVGPGDTTVGYYGGTLQGVVAAELIYSFDGLKPRI